MTRRRSALVLLAVLSLLTSCGVLPGGGEERRTVTVWLMKGSASEAFIGRSLSMAPALLPAEAGGGAS